MSGCLKAGNERRLLTVGCETIYTFIYRAQRAEQLWRYVTRRHKPPRPRPSRTSRDTIKDRGSIHERPKTIDARTEAGHWEGGLIISKRACPCSLSIARKSRVRLSGKTAAETTSVISVTFARMTSDEEIQDIVLTAVSRQQNGSASRRHSTIPTELGKDASSFFLEASAEAERLISVAAVGNDWLGSAILQP